MKKGIFDQRVLEMGYAWLNTRIWIAKRRKVFSHIVADLACAFFQHTVINGSCFVLGTIIIVRACAAIFVLTLSLGD